jgi:hypothetical protein
VTDAEIVAVLDRAERNVRFDHERHQYEVFDGFEWDRFPGVTTAIKYGVAKGDALLGWAAKMQHESNKEQLKLVAGGSPMVTVSEALTAMDKVKQAWKKRRQDAADLGTQVHALAEKYCKDILGIKCETPLVCEQAQAIFEALRRWFKSVDFRPIAAERRVYSLKYRYAGTTDLIARVNGKLVLSGDYKTNDKGVYKESYLQNYAYQGAMVEMGLPPAPGMLIRLPKNGADPEIIDVPFDPEGYLVFTRAVESYKWLSKWEKESA